MRWTADHRRYLKRHYGRTLDSVLAMHFGTSADEVAGEARALRLAKDKAWTRQFGGIRMPRWSDQDVENLRDNYAQFSNWALAGMLGRSIKSVVSKGHTMGLKKSPKRLADMGRENVRLKRDRQ